MRRALLLLIALSLVLPAVGQKKKKEGKRELPDQVLEAQFIYVTGWHGGLYDFRTPPEERSAIMRVQKALDDWPRYRLVYCPEQADIMLVVKPGHLGMAQGGVAVGPGGPEYPPSSTRPCSPSPENLDRNYGAQPGDLPTRESLGYGAEGGSPDDYLMLSLRPSYRPMDASFIWRTNAKGGLAPIKIKLLEDFKRAVEESEKARAAAKKP